jgi:putative membrane protein
MFTTSAGTIKKRRGFLRWLFAGIFALLVIGLLAGVFVFAFGHFGPGSYYYGWPFFFPFGFFLFLIGIFFVFRFAFWGWGWGRGYYRGSWRYDGADALEILGRRYARGEISKEQYEQMKSDLQQK